jgi:hypothetical protein
MIGRAVWTSLGGRGVMNGFASAPATLTGRSGLVDGRVDDRRPA